MDRYDKSAENGAAEMGERRATAIIGWQPARKKAQSSREHGWVVFWSRRHETLRPTPERVIRAKSSNSASMHKPTDIERLS